MLDTEAKIKSVRDLGARHYLLTLYTPEQARLARPGQFVMLKCADSPRELPLLRRPFSIFNIDRQARTGRPSGLELLVKDVGTGTRKLVQYRPGQRIRCLGPLGRGFQISPAMRNRTPAVCLVAGGIGIAPIFMLAQGFKAQNIRPVLFYGGATAADLVLRDRFEHLEIDIVCTTEDGSLGERGIVTQPLARFLKTQSRKNTRLYACGPWGMMKAVHEQAVQNDLPCEVSLEARMGCALGACLGCVIRSRDPNGEEQYIRVCQEGPVMDSRLVDWNTVPI